MILLLSKVNFTPNTKKMQEKKHEHFTSYTDKALKRVKITKKWNYNLWIFYELYEYFIIFFKKMLYFFIICVRI